MGTKTIWEIYKALPIKSSNTGNCDTKTMCEANSNKPNTSFLNHSSMFAGLEEVGRGFKFSFKTESASAEQIVEGIKNWYCPNCHRKKITESDVCVYMCGCGFAMRRL